MIFMPFCGALEQYKAQVNSFLIYKKTKFKRILLRNKNKKRFDLKLSVFFGCWWIQSNFRCCREKKHSIATKGSLRHVKIFP